MRSPALPLLLIMLAFLFAGCEKGKAPAPDAFSNAPGVKTFGGKMDDRGNAIAKTPDGFVIAGATRSEGRGSWDVYLIKTDEWGNVIWKNTYGSKSHDTGLYVRETPDGGFVIAGHKGSYGAGTWDALLIKTDGEGRHAWTRTSGRPGYDLASAVINAPDGGYVAVGYTDVYNGDNGDNGVPPPPKDTYEEPAGDDVYRDVYSRLYNASSSDVYLFKTDGDGNIQWEKTFGGPGDDRGYAIDSAPEGGYVIAGSTRLSDTDAWDVYLIRADENGKALWTKSYGGAGDDRGRSVRHTPDGGYVIVGRTRSAGAGGWDVYLIKTDAQGESLWTETYGGKGDDWGYAAEPVADGGYIIVGRTNSADNSTSGGWDVYLIRTNESGEAIWRKTYGGKGDDFGYDVKELSDGFVITGWTDSIGSGSWDVLLIKTDSEGNISRNIR